MSPKQKNPMPTSSLKAKGIKHGLRNVERSHYVDENGDLREDEMHMRQDKRHFENDCLQGLAKYLVWMRCLPPDPDDLHSLKSWLCWMQWLALLCDLAAATVAVVTFSDVTYCCGTPILDIAGSFPWKAVIRVTTYAYLALVILEIYPVVRKGFPFNIVNPFLGFAVTVAMFFDDSKTEALIMWGIETAAVMCEMTIFRMKARQATLNAHELKEVGRNTKTLRRAKEGEDPDAPERERNEARQRYYQLKQDEVNDGVLQWYLGLGCAINVFLSFAVLALILVIAQSGGLCVSNFNIPNVFDMDQMGRCQMCSNTTGICEVCQDDMQQCFYPYS